MAARIAGRLARAEVKSQRAAQARRATAPAPDYSPARYHAECAEFLARHAPGVESEEEEEALVALLRRILDQMTDVDSSHGESLASWRFGPRARWAMPLPDDYAFPMSLLRFLADPPHDYFFGHACERCGLSVPICTFWDGKTGPRPDPSPFRVCPACGGRASFAANWQSGPRADPP